MSDSQQQCEDIVRLLSATMTVFMMLSCAGNVSKPVSAINPSADPQIRALIAQLEDDDPLTRDRAQRQLIDLGRKAVPMLRETMIRSYPPETYYRAQKILAAIDENEQFLKVCGPIKHVTIDVKEKPLGEVANIINDRTREQISWGFTDYDLPVTLFVKDRPFFETLETLCRGNGYRFFALKAGEWRIDDDGKRFQPMMCAGQFIIQVEMPWKWIGIAGAEYMTLLTIGWQKNVTVLDVRADIDGLHNRGARAIAANFRRIEFARARRPDAEETSMDLRGTAYLSFAPEEETVVLNYPGEEGGYFETTLSDGTGRVGVRREKNNAFVVEYRAVRAPDDDPDSLSAIRERLFDRSRVVPMGEMDYPCSVYIKGKTGALRGDERCLAIEFQADRRKGPTTIKITLPKSVITKVIPFHFPKVPVQ